jgi:beta-glucosidase
MKKIIFILLLACNVKIFAQSIKTSDEQKVEALLKQMTLDEKVGQMTQVNISVVLKGGYGNQDASMDMDKLHEAVTKYKVGSILNALHGYSVATWHQIIAQIQDEAKKNPRFIPVIYGLDGVHGQTYTLDATLFPTNIGMAATRNIELARQEAKITANELRASGVRWNFAPVLDLGRNVIWPRLPETFGEDVHIATAMGAAMIKAYEEDGLKNPTAVASCMKHYIGYGDPRSGKDRTPAYIPEIMLREIFLPPFEQAVKSGASTIMINSGEVNGVPVHGSKFLLTDLLRKELGFKGVIVSDWEDIKRLYERHHVASSPKEAVKMAVLAGVDMSMVPNDYSFFDLLKELVQAKEVSMQRINESVRRILLLKAKVGLFDNAYAETNAAGNFNKPEYHQSALQAARESMTLLKNQNNLLPLSKNAKVLVAGPAANSNAALNGCWSFTWQGNDETWYPVRNKTIVQAIKEKLGAGNVIDVTDTAKGFTKSKNFDTTAIASNVAGADAIILCLGENAYAETPGNINDLTLDENQLALARAASRTGKPIILVLVEGRPRIITSIEKNMSAILMAYWPGSEGGPAIADVLFGDYNPSGRLPITYPRFTADIVPYDFKPTEGREGEAREIDILTGSDVSLTVPLYQFGHGLSYTSFSYSDIVLNSKQLKRSGTITATIKITNSGQREGAHTIELYTRDLYASITPSLRRLRAFKKINLQPGETKEVSFTLSRNDLSFINEKLRRVTEPGEFLIMIGDKRTDFTYAP